MGLMYRYGRGFLVASAYHIGYHPNDWPLLEALSTDSKPS